IELKCAEHLSNEHTAQCLNYLRASDRTLCLLVNFQKPKVEWKRIVHGFPIRASGAQDASKRAGRALTTGRAHPMVHRAESE
ncbi:MAG: GxxExxY protein, partial [Acidobacteria bacterium]|nr:GxxExxY protein [Acidobacteriota bacterium]